MTETKTVATIELGAPLRDLLEKETKMPWRTCRMIYEYNLKTVFPLGQVINMHRRELPPIDTATHFCECWLYHSTDSVPMYMSCQPLAESMVMQIHFRTATNLYWRRMICIDCGLAHMKKYGDGGKSPALPFKGVAGDPVSVTRRDTYQKQRRNRRHALSTTMLFAGLPPPAARA
jgi:hypothetical protein